MSLFYLFMQVKTKAKESKRNGKQPRKTRKEKKTPVSPQGQGKRRETSFVARKLYYNLNYFLF
jgi:hypothetical protein